MSEQFHVRLAKERFVFSAAHFITYDGDVCEPLHGHNYHVAVEIAGELDANHYVVDFIAVRDSLQKIVDGLDHRMLLPTKHPLIQVEANDTEVEVRFQERRWVFPRTDCILLPIENTTAELLARTIGRQLQDALETRTGWRPPQLVIEVDECDGQWGVCRIDDA
jgi:6-pyruvoyltetrahydropterin/6-carboxytetrahydropterin synthase